MIQTYIVPEKNTFSFGIAQIGVPNARKKMCFFLGRRPSLSDSEILSEKEHDDREVISRIVFKIY